MDRLDSILLALFVYLFLGSMVDVEYHPRRVMKRWQILLVLIYLHVFWPIALILDKNNDE